MEQRETSDQGKTLVHRATFLFSAPRCRICLLGANPDQDKGARAIAAADL